MKVQVNKMDLKTDHRGCVWEPLISGELILQQNVHVVITEPGGLRGNHRHRLGTEIATQRGPALVRFRDADGVRDVLVPEGEVYRFVFPPGCAHAFHNNGRTPNVLVSFNTQPFDPLAPDVQPEMLIGP